MRYFNTANLQLAAWLLHCGFVPEVGPKPNNPSKAEFQFESSPQLEDAAGAFLRGEARVNAATYKAALDQTFDMARAALSTGRGWQT